MMVFGLEKIEKSLVELFAQDMGFNMGSFGLFSLSKVVPEKFAFAPYPSFLSCFLIRTSLA